MSIWNGMLDTIYSTDIAAPAILTAPAVTAPMDVMAVDETSGAVIEGKGGNIGVQTVRPACRLRMTELASYQVRPADLIGGTISLRPGTPDQAVWRIESSVLKPSAYGETSGEVQLILVKQ
ncbi:hypothetical protein ACE10Z_23645 [Bradyrhizobium sp. Pha-3]|uniref:hypothetical protein n=1 Tax=Bradyrhizobium sp. Pha-3 TaxID=208375 RepID=UPI0035D438BB